MTHKVISLITKKRYCTAFVVALLLHIVSVAHANSAAHGDKYESEIVEIIELIQVGQLESALSLTEQHLQTYPQSRVAYLIKADLLHAMYSELTQVGEQIDDHSNTLLGLKHQLKNRWRHDIVHSQVEGELFPSGLIEMGKHSHVLVADMTLGRLYLYQNTATGPSLIKDYYMSVGSAGYGKQVEGDNKTPVGVYSIYEFIDPNRLPDLYGAGAFPVDYPNIIDKYRNRTGYGIWLHGTPSSTYARSPWASEGCFVLSNADLNDIAQFIDIDERTPVILSDSIEWVGQQELNAKRESYLEVMEEWKQDWQSLNTESYLSHYSRDRFNLGADDYEQWAKQKALVNRNKEFIEVDLEIDSLFIYPGEKDMFVVKFKQLYVSDNYRSETNKQQYWQKDEDGQWRIIYEG